MKVFKNNINIKLTILVLLMIVIVGSVTYAAFISMDKQEGVNAISSSCLDTNFTDGDSISLTGASALPMTSEEGLKTTPYHFEITNNCNLDSIYYVILSVKNGSFNDSFIDYSYNNSAPATLSNATVNTDFQIESGYSSSYVLTNGYLSQGNSAAYDIKLWINESATYTAGMRFEAEIKVISVVREHETILLAKSEYVPNFGTDTSNANTPKLVNNLIPVVYDEDEQVWIKAATTQTGWYNYDDQIWANAVTTTAETRAVYNAADVGTIIPMKDILGMYVWIPRYAYLTTNLGTNYAGGSKTQPGGIGIKFMSNKNKISDQTDEFDYTGYIVHPAFTDGSIVGYNNNGVYTTTVAYQFGGWDEEITGFWYGKFETSANTLSLRGNGTSTVLTDPIVKPDVVARRSQTVSDKFKTAQNISSYQGINIDSHMSKNSEWGAVAYLSQSTYGKYGNTDYETTNKEIYINNSSGYYTGRSMGMPGGATGSYNRADGGYPYNYTTHPLIDSTTGASIMNSDEYIWTYKDGVYKSSTQGKASTTTNLRFDFTLTETTNLTFDWAVSSQSNSTDYLYYTIYTGTGTSAYSGTGTGTKIGGTTMGVSDEAMTYTTITKSLPANSYRLVFTYVKNATTDTGTDTAYVKNIKLGEHTLTFDTKNVDTVVNNGTGASTTGNIYGIYDMVGGSAEYVMGYLSQNTYTVNSLSWGSTNSTDYAKFTSTPNAKYFDTYTTNNINTACGSSICYGHALSETGQWYLDQNAYVSVTAPWFLRGASYGDYRGTYSGVFYSVYSYGNSLNNCGFRAVLI